MKPVVDIFVPSCVPKNQRNLGLQLQATLLILWFHTYNTIAVSYTHLDVYKRQ